MKEKRIIALIGAYGSANLAVNFENNFLAWTMFLQAIIWIGLYIYSYLRQD